MNVPKISCAILSILALGLCLSVPSPALAAGETAQWLNQLGFVAGDANTSIAADPDGLAVTAVAPGAALVEQGLQVTPGFLVAGVRVCYQSTSAASFISQISLSQLQALPATTLVLSDGTDQVNPGPVCVDSALPFAGKIAPALGPLTLDLGMSFANTTDEIIIKGVALLTVPDPNSPLFLALKQLHDDMAALENHTHTYLTGKGVGHNNTVATTTAPLFPSQLPTVTPAPVVIAPPAPVVTAPPAPVVTFPPVKNKKK